MPDYSLVPVDYQPDFSGYSLIPVDYNPFAGENLTQAQAQQAQAQTQPAQPEPSQLKSQGPRQQGAPEISLIGVGAPVNNPQASEGESWDPDSENGNASGPNQPTQP